MNARFAVRTSPFAFVLAVLALDACSDDPVASSETPDASTDGAATDGLVPGPRPDASGDAAIDADDAGPMPVTVEVRGPDGPFIGPEVAFHAAGGATEILQVDSAGRASKIVPPGSSVTVYVGAGASRPPIFATVMGVGPGDLVPFELVGEVVQQPFEGTIQPPVDAGGNDLVSVDACGTGYSKVVSALPLTEALPRCRDAAGNVPLLFSHRPDASQHVTAFAVKTAAQPPDAGTTLSVNVVASDWATAAAPSAFSLSGTPPVDATSFALETAFLREGVSYARLSSSSNLSTDQASFVRPPAGFATLFRRSVRVNEPGGSRSILVNEPIPAGNVTQDLAALPPRLTAVAIGGTRAAPTVTVTAPSGLGATNLVALRLTNDDGPTNNRTRWIVRASPGTTVTLPTLPPTFVARVQTDWSLATAMAIEAGHLANAAAVRTAPLLVDAPVPNIPAPLTAAVVRGSTAAIEP